MRNAPEIRLRSGGLCCKLLVQFGVPKTAAGQCVIHPAREEIGICDGPISEAAWHFCRGSQRETMMADTGRSDCVTRRAVLAAGTAAVITISAENAMPAQVATIDRGSALTAVELRVNGRTYSVAIDPRVTLLDLFREHLRLTGTKKGCDHGQCGACTVLVNGRRINSCLTLAVLHDGDEITTIEGLGAAGNLHPMQKAFIRHDGFQCGYCTPGQICSAIAMLDEVRRGVPSHVSQQISTQSILSDDEIRERMSGNICRCAAYPNIVAAIREVAESLT